MQRYIEFERGLRADLVSIMRHLNRPAHMRHDLHRFCNLTDVAMTVSTCCLLASTDMSSPHPAQQLLALQSSRRLATPACRLVDVCTDTTCKSSCTAYLSHHTPTLVPCLQNMKLASFVRSNPHVFRLEHGWVFLNDFCCRAAPALTTVEEAIECLRTGKHSVSYSSEQYWHPWTRGLCGLLASSRPSGSLPVCSELRRTPFYDLPTWVHISQSKGMLVSFMSCRGNAIPATSWP